MKIAIRKENNGSIYLDKTALTRFTEEELKQPPYNYSLVDVDCEDCIAEDFNADLTFNKTKYEQRKQNTLNLSRIAELKVLLSSTDYKAIKYAEGVLTEQEYLPIKEQRENWRKEINELEVLLGKEVD